VYPLVETPANPVNAKLFTAPTVSDESATPESALAVELSDQSADDKGQTAPGAHSATRFRLSALVVLFTNIFNDADVTVAPAGNPDVSNRNNGTSTW
jgi:hypothetical protein